MTRRRLRIAIVMVLSVFVAVITESSLHRRLVAAALPEPASWTYLIRGVAPHAGQAQLHAAELPSGRLSHSFSSAPTLTDKKPFGSMRMTRDRPTGWIAFPSWPARLALQTPLAVQLNRAGSNGISSAIQPIARPVSRR